MDFTNQLILGSGILFLLSILATLLTPRLGVPLLLLFLIVGMLAGVDGPGGIPFSDFRLANLLATLALAVILFDGGMRTSFASFRVAMRPALTLATVGVIITTGIVGAYAAWLLDLNWIQGLLLGAIVGSTDAAAVFSLLQTSAVSLNRRVASALEIESGTNDPMAVFLTISLLGMLTAPELPSAVDLLLFFIWQMGLGGALGWLGGQALVRGINRLELAESLYPLLALCGGILVYGLTSVLGGSGLLAVYIAGLVMGNRRIRSATGIRRFHDGVAWLSQIGMFVVLGMLANPSQVWTLAPKAASIVLVLLLLARPIAVFASLLPFRFTFREQLYIAWVGLRGSVPIVLATYPALAGAENAALYFNVAFFIVLSSLVIQGWTVAPMARLLGITVPASTAQVHRMEFDLPGQRGYEIASYRLSQNSRLVGKVPDRLRLPRSARVISLARRGKMLTQPSWGAMRTGDYISLLVHQDEVDELDGLFRAEDQPMSAAEVKRFGEFVLDNSAPIQAVADVYGLELPNLRDGETVVDYFARHIPTPVAGDRLRLGECQLVVTRMDNGQIAELRLRLPH
ncbi:MAG: potassium/proton antiporter [Pseudomonadota bacterium]|nr:potassium/proton antiporter [Pseudomonadota bacterium]